MQGFPAASATMRTTTEQSLGSGAPVLAIDIGGTDIKYGLADPGGAFIHSGSIPTAANHPGTMIDRLSALVEDARISHPQQQPAALGVNVPGIVEEATGVVVTSANLGWSNFPLKELLESRLGLPVALGHDVQAAGFAEHRLGAARGFDNALVVVIGTGIASTIILGGQIYSGHGYAGEIGHSRIEPLGSAAAILCPCGAAGCLQTVSSASAIARHYSAAVGRDVPGAKEVMAAAANDDGAAQLVMDRAFDGLALALAQNVAMLAPEIVVIGGGLAEAGDALLEPVARRLESVLSFHRRPQLVTAALGSAAGMVGAALKARELAAG